MTDHEHVPREGGPPKHPNGFLPRNCPKQSVAVLGSWLRNSYFESKGQLGAVIMRDGRVLAPSKKVEAADIFGFWWRRFTELSGGLGLVGLQDILPLR